MEADSNAETVRMKVAKVKKLARDINAGLVKRCDGLSAYRYPSYDPMQQFLQNNKEKLNILEKEYEDLKGMVERQQSAMGEADSNAETAPMNVEKVKNLARDINAGLVNRCDALSVQINKQRRAKKELEMELEVERKARHHSERGRVVLLLENIALRGQLKTIPAEENEKLKAMVNQQERNTLKAEYEGLKGSTYPELDTFRAQMETAMKECGDLRKEEIEKINNFSQFVLEERSRAREKSFKVREERVALTEKILALETQLKTTMEERDDAKRQSWAD